MRRSRAGLFLLLLSCAGCAGAVPGPDGLVPFAVRKGATDQIIRRAGITSYCKALFPGRGIVVSAGGFLTRGASFIMVDLDRRSLRRVLIDRDTDEPSPTIRFDDTVALGPEALNGAIVAANVLWRSGTRRAPSQMVLDATSTVILLDGDAVFSDDHAREYPDAEAFINRIGKLASVLPDKPTKVAQRVSCGGS